MRFNSYVGTAIHVLLIISEESANQKVTSDVIAKKIGISSDRVRRLISVLKKAGFINVAPRKEREGTTMAMPLEKITLHDVFHAIEPNFAKEVIAPSTRLANTSYTGMYVNEIITGYMTEVVHTLKALWEKITLADTLAELKKKETAGPHDNPRELFQK
jgi:DNA-binding IscR family transcriptional regulator